MNIFILTYAKFLDNNYFVYGRKTELRVPHFLQILETTSQFGGQKGDKKHEPGMPFKHRPTTQDLVLEDFMNHCEGLHTTFP
jgi:hypothetical protein